MNNTSVPSISKVSMSSSSIQPDSINGRCKGQGLVELRCQNRAEGIKFLESLAAQGIRFTMKAARNLRVEGPTTSSVAANPSVNHINTRDLDDMARNHWLHDLKKRDERKERLLKEMQERALRI
jgi:hypothetical protein